jgi:acetoin utilization deacetylase AcuC-like enzyme
MAFEDLPKDIPVNTEFRDSRRDIEQTLTSIHRRIDVSRDSNDQVRSEVAAEIAAIRVILDAHRQEVVSALSTLEQQAIAARNRVQSSLNSIRLSQSTLYNIDSQIPGYAATAENAVIVANAALSSANSASSQVSGVQGSMNDADFAVVGATQQSNNVATTQNQHQLRANALLDITNNRHPNGRG